MTPDDVARESGLRFQVHPQSDAYTPLFIADEEDGRRLPPLLST